MLIYSYINTRENWKNSKLCENTPPCGRSVSTQFLVFPISVFVFLKYDLRISYTSLQMPDPKTEKLVLKKSFLSLQLSFGILCQQICVMPIRLRTLKTEYALSDSDLISFITLYLCICICFIIVVIYYRSVCIFFMIDVNTPLVESANISSTYTYQYF